MTATATTIRPIDGNPQQHDGLSCSPVPDQAAVASVQAAPGSAAESVTVGEGTTTPPIASDATRVSPTNMIITVRGVTRTVPVTPPSKDGLAMPGVTLTKTNLTITGDLTPAAAHDIVAKLALTDGAVRWWLGDLLAAAERRWGKFDGVTKGVTLPWGKKTIENMATVAKQVESSRRRETLSWSVHAAVASLPAAGQTHWLDEAQNHKLSLRQLRESIAAGKVIHWAKSTATVEVTGRLKFSETDDACLTLQQLNDRLPGLSEITDCSDEQVLLKWQSALTPLREFAASVSRRRIEVHEQQEARQRTADKEFDAGLLEKGADPKLVGYLAHAAATNGMWRLYLKDANAATITAALAELPASASKTTRQALKSRLLKLQKSVTPVTKRHTKATE